MDRSSELTEILESVAYELSTARAAGLSRTDDLRAALKRARGLISDADALVASIGASERARSDAD